MRPPLLVVVTGMPASGKTTLAEALARHLNLPLIRKDAVKERLYETLGVGDMEWSARLGEAAFDLLFDLTQTLLASRTSAIVEANFFRGTEPRFLTLPEHRLVQICCSAPLELLVARYTDRPRHPGHHDVEKVKELPGRFESGVHGPLDLPGKLMHVDTSHPTDSDAIAETIGSYV